MKVLYSLSVALLLSALFISPAAASGDSAADARKAPADSMPHYTMDELVVTASRVLSPLEYLAWSVSTLGRERTMATLRNSSTDLAGMLPGVFVQRTGDFGRSDVNIRGLGSRGRQALILVDGRPERMALFDCTVTHSFLLHDVERIEVVRGPSSTLYGSGAMGGVMNVIPRPVRRGLELDLRSSAGSFETLVTSGRIASRRGPFAGAVSVDYRESAGHVPHSAYDGTDLVARGEAVLPGGVVLAVSGKYFDGYKEEPLRATDDPSLVSETWNDYRRGAFDVKLGDEIDGRSWSARYYRNFGEHRFSDGWHSKDATDGVLAHAEGMIGGIGLGAGADWRLQQGELPDQAGASWEKWETGAYATATYAPLKAVECSAGARYNRDEIAGDEVSPSFGIVWRAAGGTTLRGLASHGFRSPQINELYMYPPSNTDLHAERVWNYEAGLRQRIPGGLWVDLTVFRMDGEGLIELAPNGSPPPPMRYANTGAFVFDGIEASLDGAWRCGLSGSVSWTQTDFGDLTQGRPGRKLDLDLAWTGGRHLVRLTGTHVGDYYGANGSGDPIPSYTTVDLYAETGITGGLSLFAGVRNLLDEQYSVYVDLPGGEAGLYLMPGVSLTAGFRYGL
jgi:outer membrane receptor protein involved in Fe transport